MEKLSKLSPILMVMMACSESISPPAAELPATYHRDVAPLISEKCGSCHVEGGIAPFSFQTYAQVFEMRNAIKAAVKTRIMPPWPAAQNCSEYAQDRSLSEEQIQLLSDWADEGGAEGDPADAPSELPRAAQEELPRVDLELKMAETYSPTKSPDEYRCFVLDWPKTETSYITAFSALPGRPNIVHHIVAYLVRPEDTAPYPGLEAEDSEPGYDCFGGTGGPSTWLGGWMPGGVGMVMPQGTGIRVAPGSKIILQVHYNLSSANAAPDRSSISMALASSVDKIAIMQPWANLAWLEPGGMPIPAGVADTRHRFVFDLSSVISSFTGGVFEDNKPFTIYTAAMHMHTRGTRMKLAVERKTGGTECLVDIPRWDFHWQLTYTFAQPKVINPGDRIDVECQWDNSAPDAKYVEWGEATSDEMCLSAFLITQ